MLLRHRIVQRPTAISFTKRFSTNSKTAVRELESRGLVSQITSRNLRDAADGSLAVYCGIDPSARSLHLGNLLPLITLLHFHLRGHQVISLIGGATGSIGDPGGRTSERKLLSKEQLDLNVQGITAQVHKFYENATKYAEKRLNGEAPCLHTPKVLNNLEWFQGVGLLEFLRNVGKYAKVNTMMSRDSVQSRLNSSQGISFTEFSYQLLQAHDFYTLHHDHGCRLQIGGSDQWGNIVAGIDLIKRRRNHAAQTWSDETIDETDQQEDDVFGLTIPLLTTPSGEKFGKSAGNAVWLDHGMTSVFDFYQHFIRLSDEMAVKLLPIFTLRSQDWIAGVIAKHQKDAGKRLAQRALADEVTELVHGERAAAQARTATKALYQVDITGAQSQDIMDSLQGDPRLVHVQASDILGQPLSKIFPTFRQSESRAHTLKIIKAKGFYINNQRMEDPKRVLEAGDLIGGRLAILRAGVENLLVLVVRDDTK